MAVPADSSLSADEAMLDDMLVAYLASLDAYQRAQQQLATSLKNVSSCDLVLNFR